MAGLRGFVVRFCKAARARGDAPVARARARGRAIRAGAEEASSAALLRAEARARSALVCARAAQANLLHAQRQAGAAALVAGRRLLQAKKLTASTLMRVAYGHSPPRRLTPTQWRYFYSVFRKELEVYIAKADRVVLFVQIFDAISPYPIGLIIGIVLSPLVDPVAEFYRILSSSAPQSCCPFLGIVSLEFAHEFTVEEGLAAVLQLCQRIGGKTIWVAGGICICILMDIGAFGSSLCETMFGWFQDPVLAHLPSTVTELTSIVAEMKFSKSVVYDLCKHDRYPCAFTYFAPTDASSLYASLLRLFALKLDMSLSATENLPMLLAPVEVNLLNIGPGTTVTVKWQGKQVFIRRRTQDEIGLARSVAGESLRHRDRLKNAEWTVVVAHLGCSPITVSGEFDGWFCPCHGSQYDTSGRILKGPAVFNLKIPPYCLLEDNRMLIG